jgi:uncharacterized protein YuzE
MTKIVNITEDIRVEISPDGPIYVCLRSKEANVRGVADSTVVVDGDPKIAVDYTEAGEVFGIEII